MVCSAQRLKKTLTSILHLECVRLHHTHNRPHILMSILRNTFLELKLFECHTHVRTPSPFVALLHLFWYSQMWVCTHCKGSLLLTLAQSEEAISIALRLILEVRCFFYRKKKGLLRR